MRTVEPSVDAFVDLIFDDPDLLRAEFDAIVADEWPGPPTSPRHRREPHWPQRRTPRPSTLGGVRRARSQAVPGPTDTTAWERSPPDGTY
jgi:hypothetical protein